MAPGSGKDPGEDVEKDVFEWIVGPEHKFICPDSPYKSEIKIIYLRNFQN